MNEEHKTQAELKREINDAENKVVVGAKYRHYKSEGMQYTVVGLGFWEATDELCVIYKAEYGQQVTFVRPLSVWLERVEWHGKKVPRFTQVS